MDSLKQFTLQATSTAQSHTYGTLRATLGVQNCAKDKLTEGAGDQISDQLALPQKSQPSLHRSSVKHDVKFSFDCLGLFITLYYPIVVV